MILTAPGYVYVRLPVPMGCLYASASNQEQYTVTAANMSRMIGPAIQPMVEVAHAKDRIPDPMTAVMMWAAAVQYVPATQQWLLT